MADPVLQATQSYGSKWHLMSKTINTTRYKKNSIRFHEGFFLLETADGNCYERSATCLGGINLI